MPAAAKGKVEVEHYGKISDNQTPLPLDWPRGGTFMDMMKIPSESQAEQEYWQVCVRWALLQKYELLEKYDPYVQEDGSRKLVFSSEQMQQIQSTWQEARDESGDATIPKDLSDFFKTSFSNERPLQWSLMDCGSASQFRLHAHPNIELVYCVRGELHEVRMNGDPYDVSSNGKGPSLVDCKRSWSFATLRQGCWLVNEVGSIHKSFTATSSKGCLLLVLWGGGHADVAEGEEPRAVDVPRAVNQMDSKLDCNCGTATTEIQETFLPESEKNTSSSN